MLGLQIETDLLFSFNCRDMAYTYERGLFNISGQQCNKRMIASARITIRVSLIYVTGFTLPGTL